MSELLKRHLARVVGGHRLTEEQAGEAMGAIMDGEATPAQIGALLAAMAVRGESEDEKPRDLSALPAWEIPAGSG